MGLGVNCLPFELKSLSTVVALILLRAAGFLSQNQNQPYFTVYSDYYSTVLSTTTGTRFVGLASNGPGPSLCQRLSQSGQAGCHTEKPGAKNPKMISIPCLAPHLVYDNPPITGHVILATASSCLPTSPTLALLPLSSLIHSPHQNNQQVPCQPCKLATFLASLAGPSAPGGGTVTTRNMPHYHLPVLDRWSDHGTGLISKPVKRLSSR